jgi:hypothetical protein
VNDDALLVRCAGWTARSAFPNTGNNSACSAPTSATCSRSFVPELVQKVRRLIPQLRELLDNRLPLTEPTFGLVPRLTEHAA